MSLAFARRIEAAMMVGGDAMGKAQLRLILQGPGGPHLVRSEFHDAAGKKHEGSNYSARAPALRALVACFAHYHLWPDPLVHPRAVELLREARKECGRADSPLIWPLHLLGSYAVARDLLIVDTQHAPTAVRLNERVLAPADIAFELDGVRIEHDSRRLQRLRAALLDRLGASRTAAPAPAAVSLPSLIDGVRRATGADRRVSIVLGEVDAEVPRLAAERLLAELKAYVASGGPPPWTVGISGGLLQEQVIRELLAPDLRRQMMFPIRVVALNRLRWDDWRAGRSAPHLAFLLAQCSSAPADIVIPPLTLGAAANRAFAELARQCHFFLLSGGSVINSFVSEFLKLEGEALPSAAVGDLAGHLVTATGRDAATTRIRKILAPLNCQPSLDALHEIARRGPGQVMLIADAIGGVGQPAAAKARVVRAALIAGLLNILITSRRLAEEVANLRAASRRAAA
jgi:hypothetical protein